MANQEQTAGERELLANLEKLHTTESGAARIKKNLSLDTNDVVGWCKEKVASSSIVRMGKNYYARSADCEITVNANSYTIITAHRQKRKSAGGREMTKDIVFRFVDAINRQDLPVIIDMMADDFVFIDTYGDRMGKEHMKTGWQGYFDWFPDYKIDINEYVANETFAVIMGKASASYQGKADRYWEFPAAWKVVTSREQVKVWQVFCDSKKQLDSMADPIGE